MFIGQQSSIFVKKQFRYGVDYQFSPKIIRHPRLKARKRWKLAFRRGGRVKNSKNFISAMAEKQKMKKYRFRRGGKSKTDKFCVSAVADERKTVKLSFPSWEKSKIGENRISLTGKTKNQRKILSQDWEDGKMWKIGFPKLGKNKRTQRLRFPPQTFHITAEDLLPAKKIDYLKLKW